MEDKFDENFKDFMKDEFLEIKASPNFKKQILKNVKKEKRNIISRIWNYEVEIDLRAGIAAVVLIVLLPSLYVINKAHEIKENESKIYIQQK